MLVQRCGLLIYRIGRQLMSLETEGVQALRAKSRRSVRGLGTQRLSETGRVTRVRLLLFEVASGRRRCGGCCG
jgi:hypothetical protein